MINSNYDTIVSLATSIGKSSVAIVRISGIDALIIAKKIAKNCNFKPRIAHHTSFYDQNGIIDTGLAIYFKTPNSFTGEEIVEFQCHGGVVVSDMLIQLTLKFGCRIAEAGEFSKRAFLNDKINLTQAEAIADLIEASSIQAVRSASRSLQGDFSKEIYNLVQQNINLRIYIEAAIDFPEEEIDFLADKNIISKFNELKTHLKEVLSISKQGALLRNGINLVIAGKPNAGKSSLLNRLAGKQSAIVTHIPGTTRDTLTENIQIKGIPLHIIDTAGLRDTNDIVESEGVKRAYEAIENADHILYVIDINDDFDLNNNVLTGTKTDNISKTFVYNKIDLLVNKDIENTKNNIYISASENIGIDFLKKHILHSIGYNQEIESVFIARRRHLNALESVLSHYEIAEEHLKNKDGELLAEELKLSQEELSSITGEFSNNDLLGEIFSSFCIGK